MRHTPIFSPPACRNPPSFRRHGTIPPSPPGVNADKETKDSLYPILQSADVGDVDGEVITVFQGEMVRRHNAGAGQQNDAFRKTILASQPGYEVRERAFHRRQVGRALKYHRASAADGQANGHALRRRHGSSQSDDWTERTRAVVDFCLWQIKWIFTFDVSRTHIVADGVTDNFH